MGSVRAGGRSDEVLAAPLVGSPGASPALVPAADEARAAPFLPAVLRETG